MAEMTPEQQAAIRAATARLQAQKGQAPAPDPAPEPSEEPQAEDDSFAKKVLRASGPTIRGAGPYAGGAAIGAAAGSVIPGVGTALGGATGAGVVGLMDLGTSIYNPIASAVGLPKMKGPHEAVGEMLTKMGVPESNTTEARIYEAIAGGVAGGPSAASGFDKAANVVKPGTTREVLNQLAKPQGVGGVVASATGAAAGQTATEMGGGPISSIIANMAGSAIPGGLAAAAKAPFRGSSTPLEIQARAQAAREVGVKPNAALVAPSVVNRAMAKALSGTEEAKDYSARTVKAVEKEIDKIAGAIGVAEDPNKVGKMIEKALGSMGFAARAKVAEGRLWDKWWNTATKTGTGQMPVDKTMAYLQKSQQGIPGYEGISELLKDKQLGKALAAFQEDMAPKGSSILGPDGKPVMSAGKSGVSYEAIKELRTIIGEKLDPTNLSPDVSRKALKGLYGALSEDIKGYAKSLGKNAEQQFNRANNFTRGKQDRIETWLQDTQNKKPYQVWRYATSPDSVKDGGQQFMALNKSMSQGEREIFHASFIKQMGKDERGEFNPAVFRDRYKQLSPNVKSALLPEAQRPAIDRVMKVIDGLDRAGTLAGQSNQTSYLGAYMLVGALLHAHPKALMTILVSSSKTEKLAKALSDPRMIDHISGVNEVPKAQVTRALNAYVQAAKVIEDKEEE